MKIIRTETTPAEFSAEIERVRAELETLLAIEGDFKPLEENEAAQDALWREDYQQFSKHDARLALWARFASAASARFHFERNNFQMALLSLESAKHGVEKGVRVAMLKALNKMKP